jgi:predicted dehydrogenase
LDTKRQDERPVGVAIIGCGNLGARHARNLATLPGVRLTAFVDRDITRAHALAEALGLAEAHVTADASDVFGDAQCAGVVIATHHDSHPGLAIAAARAEKHMLVEKPLALDEPTCRAVEHAVRAAGVHLLMGFQARCAPLAQRARDWVPAPRIVTGSLIAGRWADDAWAQLPDTGGGNVLSQGVHAFDLLSWAAGAPAQVIFAEGGTLTHDPATTDVVDSVLCTIRFANGVLGTLTIGDFGPSPWTLLGFYQLFDARGRSATLHHFFEGLCLGTAQSPSMPFGPPREPAQEIGLADLEPADRDDPYGYAALAREFATCIRTGCPSTFAADARDGRRATAAVHAAFASIRARAPVTLDD